MRKVVIIGASSGIGLALARVFADNGYVLGLTARRVELLEKLQKEIKAKSYIKFMDLTEASSAMQTLRDLIEEMNGIDIIVINSGVGSDNENLQWEKEKPCIDVNVAGFTAMANVATHYFSKKGRGHIVGISSVAAIRPYRTAPAYGASKAYMSFYLKGLRLKFAKQRVNIFVTDVKPGFVRTAMVKDNDRMFWIASPEKAAAQIFKAIKEKRRHVYITRRWRLVAWIIKILPDFIYNRI